jgi:hypothetical protein
MVVQDKPTLTSTIRHIWARTDEQALADDHSLRCRITCKPSKRPLPEWARIERLDQQRNFVFEFSRILWEVEMKTLVAAAAIMVSAPAMADHWRQTADPQLVVMFEQLMSFYAMNCQMGDQNACLGYEAAGQQGIAMLNASYDCVAANNQMACNFYQQSAQQLMGATQQVQQFMGGGLDPSAVNPLGATHQDRMANIEAWGAQNTANWQDRMTTMDTNHNAFIDMIRQ